MNRNNTNNPVKHMICFLVKIAVLYTLIPVFTVSAAETSSGKHRVIYQPHYYSDRIDGEEDSDRELPDTLEKLVKMLEINLDQLNSRHILHKRNTRRTGYNKIKNNSRINKNYYLKMENLEDVNNVFFALEDIYGFEIECDTSSILLTYQLRQRSINIKNMYNFLTARAAAPKDELIGYEHPYHVNLINILSSAGVELKYIDEKDQPDDLPGNLPVAKDNIILLSTQGHMSVVKALSDKMYEYSMWNATDGIFYRQNRLGRPDEENFRLKIVEYGIIQDAA